MDIGDWTKNPWAGSPTSVTTTTTTSNGSSTVDPPRRHLCELETALPQEGDGHLYAVVCRSLQQKSQHLQAQDLVSLWTTDTIEEVEEIEDHGYDVEDRADMVNEIVDTRQTRSDAGGRGYQIRCRR